MPKLIRLYITQVLVGFGLSAAMVGLLLWANVANLWHLVTHSQAGLLAVFLLWLFNGIVFGGVQFAIRIMMMAQDDDEPRGGRRVPMATLQPIPVKAEATRQQRQLRLPTK